MDVSQHSPVEAESEQNLPGEGVLLAFLGLRGHLLSGVIGFSVSEQLCGCCAWLGVGVALDTARR